MTMREFLRELVVYDERRTEEGHKALSLAWHIDALRRQERPPSLERLLRKHVPPQTPIQQADVLRQMAEGYGLKIRRGKKRKNKLHG